MINPYNNFEINCIIDRYLLQCPEIIETPGVQNPKDLDSTIWTIFANKSRGIHRLISLIPYRAKPATIEFMLESLLRLTSERLNASFIVDIVAACVDHGNTKTRRLPNNAQTVVFLGYAVRDVAAMEAPSDAPSEVTEALVSNRVSLVKSVLSTIISESASAPELIHLLVGFFRKHVCSGQSAAQKIEASLADLYPAFMNDLGPPSINITRASDVDKLATRDRVLNQLIAEMYTNFRNSELNSGMEKMQDLMDSADAEPKVFIRQIPGLTARLRMLSQLPIGIKRMKEVGYFDFYLFALRVVTTTDPHCFEPQEPIREMLEFYFEFFKSRMARSKTAFIDIVKLVLDVCLIYLERCRSIAEPFLFEKIAYLCEMKSYVKYDVFYNIIEALRYFPEKRAVMADRPRKNAHVHPTPNRDYRESRRSSQYNR
ncbi:hypothetical protein L596_014555 [Steinernema carpocapsae]|uniref:Integrator complex subunit 1 R3 domain-containing protein n=1 Tax=Steinernema carpocapsae TaxID=34508 RepID=A0A4V6A2U1_STECR|nr:hypothetical protein L596_014555 [Steinernema carpocapsae]